jgi:succinate dehydrogenase / fumarate reductase, iron-sulfur subunit
MKVLFKVVRQTQQDESRVQEYLLDVEPGNTILDCLNRIKWEQDGSLAFRKNCRNVICGSCSMSINGRAALACNEVVGHELERQQQLGQSDPPEIEIAPMGNMPVIKDLVVDMSSFWQNLNAVDPYVSTAARSLPPREFLQLPAERSQLNQTGNCILCGACYSECNAREVNPDFLGPHALAKAERLLIDSRDTATDQRLEKYDQGTQGVWGCTRCYMCNAVCPLDVAPMDQIGYIKQDILAHQEAPTSRSQRHRKIMVDLVKQDGWIDERKFGVMVVGNYFRDLQGLASLVPLGLRMLTKHKFPMAFHRSAGAETVKALIESVQQHSD